MELLLEEGSIAERIKKLSASHIVTAYIERGWPGRVVRQMWQNKA